MNSPQHTNTDLIQRFYSYFAEKNLEGMLACYHDEIVFEDPAFGRLEGDRARSMWQMLLPSKNANLSITFEGIVADENVGKAQWMAKYLYGPHKRKVTNQVTATFAFKGGKIIRHTDRFSVWKWSRQALGAAGYLLGWTPFLKRRVQQMANRQLDLFLGNIAPR